MVNTIGVIGASSSVGQCAISQLLSSGAQVAAFSRTPNHQLQRPGLQWHDVAQMSSTAKALKVTHLYCFAPIWILETYLPALQNCSVVRLVALSSTSIFTKVEGACSADPREHAVAARLQQGEANLAQWAQKCQVEWIVLRPTLIFGGANDRNLSEIRRFIKRFKFFLLLGEAKGLRQPVRVEDVARAAIQVMNTPSASNRAYNIAGGETLTYREMVVRLFIAHGLKPRFVRVPTAVFRIVVAVARLLPRYRTWSVDMAVRMNSDLVFDTTLANQDFGFVARDFDPSHTD